MKDKDGEQNGFMEKRGNGESNEGDVVRYEGRVEREHFTARHPAYGSPTEEELLYANVCIDAYKATASVQRHIKETREQAKPLCVRRTIKGGFRGLAGQPQGTDKMNEVQRDGVTKCVLLKSTAAAAAVCPYDTLLRTSQSRPSTSDGKADNHEASSR
ncbi:hypothetical protein EYF80_005049 [Liparis tanakae]|uniref:Uncharacterized protein n=1 Tax=Liparis tanakae TaxID=230148 RepID=A0A4Z2J420_9TELE|nr:hypothetical protein EYF80_005049 [Liparis tanakae]